MVRDRVTDDGDLIEDTDDWLAQARDRNVWYFGEEVKDYETPSNGIVAPCCDSGGLCDTNALTFVFLTRFPSALVSLVDTGS